jgi:hypothetical protein
MIDVLLLLLSLLLLLFVAGIAQSVRRRAMGWMAEESDFDSWQREHNFIFSTVATLALGLS